MKRFIIFCLMHVVLMNIYAQQVSLNSVSLRQSDLLASTQPRTDSNGKNCAIVKVDVIGVNDLEFLDAVGDVDYHLGEYVVYVPEGLKVLKYKNVSGSISGVVDFEEYGLEIEPKRVYNVVFETDNHIRAAIFSIQPQNAKLIFDGNEIPLDKNGLVEIEKPIGKYNYVISAQGYEPQSGTVELSEDEIFTTTNVSLKQKMHPLTIISSPKDATLFIDNVPYGKMNEIGDLNITEGEHLIRLTAMGYEDFDVLVDVDGQVPFINATLKHLKEQTVKYKNERTRTSVNVRNGSYFSIGGELFDKYKYEGHDWGIKADFSFIQHFGALFAAREGFGAGILNRNRDWVDEQISFDVDSANLSWCVEIPLQLGISIPFGKFNKSLFSVFGGGYGKVIFTNVDVAGGMEETETIWDYGVRLTAQLDIRKFVIGGDFSNSLNGLGSYFGIRIGVRMGK